MDISGCTCFLTVFLNTLDVDVEELCLMLTQERLQLTTLLDDFSDNRTSCIQDAERLRRQLFDLKAKNCSLVCSLYKSNG